MESYFVGFSKRYICIKPYNIYAKYKGMITLVLLENGKDTNAKIKSYFLLFSLLIGFVLCKEHLFLVSVLTDGDCDGLLSPGRGSEGEGWQPTLGPCCAAR